MRLYRQQMFCIVRCDGKTIINGEWMRIWKVVVNAYLRVSILVPFYEGTRLLQSSHSPTKVTLQFVIEMSIV
jgi:hypothetical protein